MSGFRVWARGVSPAPGLAAREIRDGGVHDEVDALRANTIHDLEKYVEYAERLGFKADYRFAIGTEAVESVVELCEQLQREFPRSIFYLGQLVFENDRFYYRVLHNETAFAIQRRLQFAGLQAVVLPIRVSSPKKPARVA